MVSETSQIQKQNQVSLADNRSTAISVKKPKQSLIPSNNRQSNNLTKQLHQIEDSTTAKAFQGTGDALNQVGNSTTNIFTSALSQAKNLFQSGSQKRGTKDLFFGLLTAGFGLVSFKELIKIPKLLSQPKEEKGKSPLVFTGAKLLTGSALALGLFRSVMGSGAALGGPGILVGLAIFVGLNLLTNTYENPNGAPSRLANLFGAREKLVGLMNGLKFGGMNTNESMPASYYRHMRDVQ